MDDNQKKFILPLANAIDTEFFFAYLPIFVWRKTKGTVGAVYVLCLFRPTG